MYNLYIFIYEKFCFRTRVYPQSTTLQAYIARIAKEVCFGKRRAPEGGTKEY
jgi:hypothetical protein